MHLDVARCVLDCVSDKTNAFRLHKLVQLKIHVVSHRIRSQERFLRKQQIAALTYETVFWQADCELQRIQLTTLFPVHKNSNQLPAGASARNYIPSWNCSAAPTQTQQLCSSLSVAWPLVMMLVLEGTHSSLPIVQTSHRYYRTDKIKRPNRLWRHTTTAPEREMANYLSEHVRYLSWTCIGQ